MPKETSGTPDLASDGLSWNEGLNDITSILANSEDPLLNPGAKDAEGDVEEVEQDEASDEDQLQLDDEDTVEQEAEDADPQEDQRQAKGAEFVPETGKVTMPDGKVLTVAELKRDHLYQQDYSRKTMALAEDSKQVTEAKELVAKHAEAVARQRQVMAALLEEELPKPPAPELARTDPYAYGIQRAEFETKQAKYSQVVEAINSAQKMQAETYQAELAKVKQDEAAKLFEKMPHLKDQKKFAEWYSEAGTLMMEKYGFTAEEVNEATDHRFYRMMDDLKRLHKALDKAKPIKPGQQKQVQQGKPKLLAGSNRNAPPVSSQNKQRQVYGERLKKSGTLQDAIGKLSTFEL